MKILDEGHKYLLKLNGQEKEEIELTFYKDSAINGNGYDGTTNQEVLRALIDRVKFLNKQNPHRFNDEIIYHLRQALALHEMRHIERCVEENYPIENVKLVGSNDHFINNKSLWEWD